MTFDPNKNVRTRNGRPVRILAANVMDPARPILGLVLTESGHEEPHQWSSDGSFNEFGGSPYDLVNVPDPVFCFFNFNPSYRTFGKIHATLEDAREACRPEARTIKMCIIGDEIHAEFVHDATN